MKLVLIPDSVLNSLRHVMYTCLQGFDQQHSHDRSELLQVYICRQHTALTCANMVSWLSTNTLRSIIQCYTDRHCYYYY